MDRQPEPLASVTLDRVEWSMVGAILLAAIRPDTPALRAIILAVLCATERAAAPTHDDAAMTGLREMYEQTLARDGGSPPTLIELAVAEKRARVADAPD